MFYEFVRYAVCKMKILGTIKKRRKPDSITDTAWFTD